MQTVLHEAKSNQFSSHNSDVHTRTFPGDSHHISGWARRTLCILSIQSPKVLKRLVVKGQDFIKWVIFRASSGTLNECDFWLFIFFSLRWLVSASLLLYVFSHRSQVWWSCLNSPEGPRKLPQPCFAVFMDISIHWKSHLSITMKIVLTLWNPSQCPGDPQEFIDHTFETTDLM